MKKNVFGVTLSAVLLVVCVPAEAQQAKRNLNPEQQTGRVSMIRWSQPGYPLRGTDANI